MPQQTSREVVQDPNAVDPASQGAARSLGLSGGGNPHQSGGDVSGDKLSGLFDQLGGVLAQTFDAKKDEYITQGKIAYMSGVTDASLIRGGNKYTTVGWQTLAAADKANNWYMDKVTGIGNGDDALDPQDYQKALMKSRADQLAALPDDPDVRKVYSDAFEQLGPKLSALQTQQNSVYNQKQTATQFGLALGSMTSVNPDRTRYLPDTPNLAASPGVVAKPAALSENDRDAAIRTVLGEAADQGDTGQAAVAWSMKNRLEEGHFGDSVYKIAHAEKQYSAWNAANNGGNDLVRKFGPGTPQYERAGRVVDQVFGGHVPDMTGGAVNYLSESGMKATGTPLPDWFKNATGARIHIGGHTFLAQHGTGTADATPVLTGNDTPGGVSLEERDAAAANKQTHMTQVQDFVQNYPGMKPADKANALGDAMVRALKAGDDTLWNDAGGVALLYKMGADPSSVDSALAAKDAFDQKKANEFNIDTERKSQDIIEQAQSGALDRPGVENAVNNLYETKQLDSNHAKSLLNSAYGQIYTSPKSANPQFQSELANIYQSQQEGGDFIKATNRLSWVAAKYGVPPKEVDTIIGTMASIENGNRNALITKAQAAADKATTEENTKKIVSTALSNGTGLDNIGAITNGTITVKNNDGTTSQVSPKDWGISQVREQETAALQAVVQQHPDQANVASALLDQRVYTTLAKQNVVDDAQASAMTAALTGDLVNKDGTIAQSAIAAYDLYKRMATNPDIGEAYAKKYLTTDATRALAETARTLDSGRPDQSPADLLRKANEMMKAKLTTPDAVANANTTFAAQNGAAIKTGLTNAMNTDWFPWLISGNDISDPEKAAVLGNTGAAEVYVAGQAKSYQMQFPELPTQTHVNMAIQDLAANSRVVMGNLVVGKDGDTLSNDMGLTGLDKFAPDRAIKHYLDADAGTGDGKTLGEKLWGQQWINYSPKVSLMGGDGSPVRLPFTAPPNDAFGNPQGNGPQTPSGGLMLRRDTTDVTVLDPQGYHHPVPPVSVSYSPATKQFTLRLWKDDARTQLATDDKGQSLPAVHLDALEVGNAYRTELHHPSWLNDNLVKAGMGVSSIIQQAPVRPSKGNGGGGF